jgi:hypothetical protein
MLAPCGIVCADCSIYKAAHDLAEAEKLAEQWRKGGNKEVTAKWFNCQGCKGDDTLVWSGDCKIRQCCLKERKLEHCAQCGDFPCEHIVAFENDKYKQHRAAVGKLREMRAATNNGNDRR